MANNPYSCIAVDWGNSNRRAWALGHQGELLEQRADDKGLLAHGDRRFAQSLAAFLGDWLAAVPGIPIVMAGMGGANSGFMNVMLVDRAERKRSQQEIFDALQPVVRSLSGARSFVSQDQTIGGGRRGGLPVQFVVQAPDFERLREKLPLFIAEAEKDPTFR